MANDKLMTYDQGESIKTKLTDIANNISNINKNIELPSSKITTMQNYTKGSSTASISPSDSLNQAVAKLENRTDVNENNISSITSHITPTKLAELSANGTAEFAATQYNTICLLLTNNTNHKTTSTTLPAIFFEYGFEICADVDSAQATALKGAGNTYTVTVPSGHKVYIYGY